jgi:hypothetical protein
VFIGSAGGTAYIDLMSDAHLAKQLAELFDRAGHAHHQAFLAVNGEDPEWAAWYARWLLDPLGRALDRAYTIEELTALLESADELKHQQAPDADWRMFYAGFFVEQSRPERTQ